MPALKSLPAHYDTLLQMDLENNRRLRREIGFSAVIIALIMGFYGNSLRPISRYCRSSLDQAAYVFIGVILYMVLHEVIHGIFMWAFSGQKAHLGIRCGLSYARSDMIFNRLQYTVIALAPIVIWGVILGVLCHRYIRTDWFWTFYLIEIINICGAASDVYVVFRFLKLPHDILVRDSGTSITVYAKAS